MMYSLKYIYLYVLYAYKRAQSALLFCWGIEKMKRQTRTRLAILRSTRTLFSSTKLPRKYPREKVVLTIIAYVLDAKISFLFIHPWWWKNMRVMFDICIIKLTNSSLFCSCLWRENKAKEKRKLYRRVRYEAKWKYRNAYKYFDV